MEHLGERILDLVVWGQGEEAIDQIASAAHEGSLDLADGQNGCFDAVAGAWAPVEAESLAESLAELLAGKILRRTRAGVCGKRA